MKFTCVEVEYLSRGFDKSEVRSQASPYGWPPLPADMPANVVQRVLEYRAKKIGTAFTEFRSRANNFTAELIDGLEERLRFAKPF
jgi:hypothetical protein